MKIKRLEICGFKSFVDRTALTFPDLVTGIVGPNGCGKSNIVDAIRWVMGEQSAKHLRGRGMEDVIFGGSEARGPAGMAEVSLTFDASALPAGASAGGVPWGAASPSEIVVTRRLYRGGDSEYLLQGVPCRLRDIVDFFLGTGVGTKAYSIIEQGRVGFIVSSRPEDRRTLIDEAAGITKYKAKKKQAERKMEATRQHLLRVSDRIGEIDGRLRSLRLQAQKAERYRRYRAELKDLELWEASHRLLGLVLEARALNDRRAALTDEHAGAAAALEREDAEVEAARLALAQESGELSAAKDELYALGNRANLDLQRSEHLADEAQALAARAQAAAEEAAGLESRLAAVAAERTALAGDVGRFDDEAEARQRAYGETEAAHARLRAGLDDARARLERALAESAAGRERGARLESEIEAAGARRQEIDARLGALVEEERQATADDARLDGEAERLRERLAALALRGAERATRRAELEARQAGLRADAARGEVELETLREEARRRRSRLESLTEIQERYESFQRGVRAIMQRAHAGAAPEGDPGTSAGDDVAGLTTWSAAGVKGLVADIVQPPPELEIAVEAVLGERLGNIIVESQDVGLGAIEYLKRRSEGRGSFIPLDARAPATRSLPGSDAPGGQTAPAETVLWPAGEGVRGPMLELIGYDRAYDKIATCLLGDVLVVDDLQRALALWRETRTSRTIVTLGGEVVDPHGVVTGGSRESAVAGVLSQKREIRELEDIVARIDADMQAALARHVAVKQALAETGAELEGLAAATRDDDLGRVVEEKDLHRVLGERRRLGERREQLSRAVGEGRATLADLEIKLADGAAALAEARRLVLEAEGRAAEARAVVADLSSRLDASQRDVMAFKVEASAAALRRAAAHDRLERLEREHGEQLQRRERLQLAATEDAARAAAEREEARVLRDAALLARAEAEARARVHAERQAALDERTAALARRDADLRAARARVTLLAQELAELQLRCQEVDLKASGLETQIQTRYPDVSLRAALPEFHLRPPVGPTEEQRMDELRGLLDRMGEVNLAAIAESEELQQRSDFLTAQRADLESALAQLETAIEKINRTSRKRFRETFDAVNAKFQEVFPRLFGGGRASLQLTSDGDLLEAGVEILANPPGKKVAQNIELLSGGEKALTAVSLLFAIFLVKPSPFCLLDEVDAPLDEANVGRFNQMIREMTHRSQFILITHNRRTMENVDRLCGITMQEPGVSKIVAVNLRRGRAPVQPEPAITETQAQA